MKGVRIYHDPISIKQANHYPHSGSNLVVLLLDPGPAEIIPTWQQTLFPLPLLFFFFFLYILFVLAVVLQKSRSSFGNKNQFTTLAYFVLVSCDILSVRHFDANVEGSHPEANQQHITSHILQASLHRSEYPSIGFEG